MTATLNGQPIQLSLKVEPHPSLRCSYPRSRTRDRARMGHRPGQHGVARMRDVPLRVNVAAAIGHPVRFGAQLHKRWQYATTLPGDHWHDFQSLKCFTAEGRSLRHPVPTFTASGGLLAGQAKETGQHVPSARIFMIAPGVIRQTVKTALALTALLILWEQPGFLPWLAALFVTCSIYALVLNAAHKR